MNKYFVLILGSFLILGGMASPASAQFGRQGTRPGAQGNDRVCLYRDNNFNGREQCYYPGDEISDARNADVSSIRVFGRAAAILYEDRNFRGNTVQFTSNAPDLERVWMSGSRSWNDRVGSLRVTTEGAYNSGNNRNRDYGRDNGDYRDNGRYGYPSNTQLSQNSICVYENPNYQGRSECWAAGAEMPDLARWSDKISSIRVTGTARAMVYRDIQFQGERQIINRDIPNLAQVGRPGGNWNDQISSLEVQGTNSGRFGRRQ